MNKRDSKLLDLLIDEVFGAPKIFANVNIGVRCKWNREIITEAIATVGTKNRYKVSVSIWATSDGWVYGAVDTHKDARVIPICREAALFQALWAGTAQYLPGLSKLACMIN